MNDIILYCLFFTFKALPMVTVESNKIEVLKYETQVQLKCKVTSESNLKYVKWFKDEQHIQSESFDKDNEKDNSTYILTLNEIKDCDIGEYRCEVHNAKGSSISELIHVVYGKFNIRVMFFSCIL